MKTVTLRQDVYHGLLTQLQEQQAELREWRAGAKAKPQTLMNVHALQAHLKLAPGVAGMAAIMLESPGRLFGFTEIVDAARPYGTRVADRVVNAESMAKTRMAMIRRALESIGIANAFATVRGGDPGYLMQPEAAAALKAWLSKQQAVQA